MSLHRVWDLVILWIRNYLKECEKAKMKPDYNYIKKNAYRLVRINYQERKR